MAAAIGSRAKMIASTSSLNHSPRAHRASGLQIQCMALSRKGKEATLTKVNDIKSKADMAFAFKYETMTVNEMEDFRASLPDDASCVVIKNRLVKLSFGDDEQWSPLCDSLTGMNAFVFTTTESIKPTIKAYLKTAKDLKKKPVPPEITGGVFDGQFLSPQDVEKLEDMPTKEELYAKIAGLIKQIPTKVAVGVKQVPTKIAYGVRAMSEKEDDSSA